MIVECEAGPGRADVFDLCPRLEGRGRRSRCGIDRATRIVGLRPWLALIAVCCLMLWVVAHQTARAEDPKAAARALGQTGNTAAGAIARDVSKAGTVPGYPGTDVPERDLTASGMENAARARLGDADDPGGAAGRAVVEGAAIRPERPVSARGPEAARAEAVAANPQSSTHGADGLASGGISECDAGLEDAQAGGSCARVTYCVGAGCESVRAQSNTGFVDATARLNMVLEMGGEEFDRESLRFFTGGRRTCNIRLFGLANCCTNSGALVGLANCSAEEVELAEERNAGNTRYLGQYCARRTFFGVCIRRARAWCVFGSKLGRILQEQGRAQLGVGWGSCRGLTVAEVERIEFDRLDLSEFTENLMDGGQEPAISLPHGGDTRAAMRTRIRDFYTRSE